MEQERFLLKISTNLFIVSDYEGAVSYASPKAVLLFGFSDIKDARLSSCLSRENWQELRRHISDVLLTKIPGYFTLRHQNRFFNVYIYSHNGKAAQCWEDITERRQLSRSLHRTSERLEFAEKTTGLGYWELDIKARKLYWSAQMYRLFGLDARSVSHKHNIIRDRILPEDYPCIIRNFMNWFIQANRLTVFSDCAAATMPSSIAHSKPPCSEKENGTRSPALSRT